MAASNDPRAALQAERVDLLARIAALRREFGDMVTATAGSNADDEHDPEGATIAFERQQVAALLGQEHEHLSQVDAALQRVDDGSYGRCLRCGRPISAERLAARPAAATCIECAAARR